MKNNTILIMVDIRLTYIQKKVVSLNNEISSLHKISTGVPQRSFFENGTFPFSKTPISTCMLTIQLFLPAQTSNSIKKLK